MELFRVRCGVGAHWYINRPEFQRFLTVVSLTCSSLATSEHLSHFFMPKANASASVSGPFFIVVWIFFILLEESLQH